jgi:anti-anti-sigma factor
MRGGELLRLKVTRGFDGTQVIIHAEGEIDIATAPTLRACIEAVLKLGSDVVLDLGGIEFIDVSGIRVIAAAFHRADALDAYFRVQPSSRVVTRILGAANALKLLRSGTPRSLGGAPGLSLTPPLAKGY